MIQILIHKIKNLEKNIVKIMKYGFLVSLFIGCLSSFVLITYELNPISFDLYYSGLLLFKASLLKFAIPGNISCSSKKTVAFSKLFSFK